MKPYSQRKRFSNDSLTKDPDTPAVSTSSSGSGSQFPWTTLINGIRDLGVSIANIWSPAGNYTSASYAAQLRQEKQTNTILWVVIGLVLALGVVLVLRKNK